MDPRVRYEIQTPAGPMTRSEAASFYNIPKGTLIRRIWQKWPPEKWFIPPRRAAQKPDRPQRRRGRYITPYGRVSLCEIAERIGLSWAGIRTRLYQNGWSEEEAFNTPPYGRPGQHFILSPEEYRLRRNAVLEAAYKEKLDREHARRVSYNKRRRALRRKEEANESQ